MQSSIRTKYLIEVVLLGFESHCVASSFVLFGSAQLCNGYIGVIGCVDDVSKQFGGSGSYDLSLLVVGRVQWYEQIPTGNGVGTDTDGLILFLQDHTDLTHC